MRGPFCKRFIPLPYARSRRRQMHQVLSASSGSFAGHASHPSNPKSGHAGRDSSKSASRVCNCSRRLLRSDSPLRRGNMSSVTSLAPEEGEGTRMGAVTDQAIFRSNVGVVPTVDGESRGPQRSKLFAKERTVATTNVSNNCGGVRGCSNHARKKFLRQKRKSDDSDNMSKDGETHPKDAHLRT